MTGPIARILLRYGVGALVMWGLFSPDVGELIVADHDVAEVLQASLGLAIGTAVEGYYWLAKRRGWRT